MVLRETFQCQGYIQNTIIDHQLMAMLFKKWNRCWNQRSSIKAYREAGEYNSK